MKSLYLIGGGPNAGKTSTAKELSLQHGIKHVKADKYVGEHQTEAMRRRYPINTYLNSLDDREHRLEMIKLTAKQEVARHTELFLVFLEELKQLQKQHEAIMVEGNFLLPDLVAEHLDDYNAVWLIPTVEFQNHVYLKQEWALKLIQQAQDPGLTLKSWIDRDQQFNAIVREQTQKHDFPCLTIDGDEPLEHTIQWVEQQFELSS